jgi:exonuclease III
MRGRGIEKWHYINQLLRDKRIEILALQEAHLLDCHVVHLHDLYPKRLHILHSSDPNAPNAKGIALVLNKEITTTINLTCTLEEHCFWRRTGMQTKSLLYIIVVYAPNTPNENKDFWMDIMLGDFNIVEDSIDRLACHPDNHNAVEAQKPYST